MRYNNFKSVGSSGFKGNSNLKVVFIVMALSQPRCIKRIVSIAKAGFECVVYGYDRGLYNNAYPNNIDVNVLVQLTSGSGNFAKVRLLKKDVTQIILENGHDNVIYYSFGLLPAIWLDVNRVKYIYEISDIMYAYPSYKVIEPFLKILDKRLIKDSYMTVMTSEGFRQYFKLNYPNIIVQPNKVNATLCDAERSPLAEDCDRHLVFAYVGAIRYDTIFRFAEIIGKFFPQHEYHFYGKSGKQSMEKVARLTSTYSNIKQFGAFRNPEDLPGIYKNIDIITACYQVSSLNERIAEPNKLYESLFFCKPIVVSEGIFLSEQVRKFKCGYCIDASTEESILEFVNSLNGKELSEISRREYNIDKALIIDDENGIVERLNNVPIG